MEQRAPRFAAKDAKCQEDPSAASLFPVAPRRRWSCILIAGGSVNFHPLSCLRATEAQLVQSRSRRSTTLLAKSCTSSRAGKTQWFLPPNAVAAVPSVEPTAIVIAQACPRERHETLLRTPFDETLLTGGHHWWPVPAALEAKHSDRPMQPIKLGMDERRLGP